MRLVFDLDETLVHTKEANRQAYACVGAWPPQDFHVRPWQEWCGKDTHERKMQVLDKFRGLMTPGPAFYLLVRAGGSILTNASTGSLSVILGAFPVLREFETYHEHDPEMKIRWLRTETPGAYFDNSLRMVERVRRETGWQAVCTEGLGVES